MLHTTAHKKTTKHRWRVSMAAIVTSVVLGVPFLGNVHSADNDGAKGMGSMDMSKSMKGMEMHMSMMKGMKEMEAMKSTGDPDYDFAMMMKKHHQSALDMANIELKHGKDSKLRSMAKAIIASQQKEIKEFDNWLAKHKQPTTDRSAK